MSQNTSNTIKTISTTCGGVGSWLQNALGNAGPGSGSILSLPPYSSSSTPSRSSFEFPGIFQSGGSKGGTRRRTRKKSRRTNKLRKNNRRVRHTKRTRKH